MPFGSVVGLKNSNGVTGLFLIAYQIVFLISLPLYIIFFDQSAGLWIWTFVLVFLCGIGVTSLYHRHYSHRTYKMSKIVEVISLFFGTLAMQGSALKWSHDHRLHHTHVDTDKDPYSINKGFWYAHFLWMLERPKEIKPHIVHDLMKNKLVMFQHKYYVTLLVITNASVVVFFGWLFNDYVGAFVLTFLTRLFINHHTTWFINSLAHTWGVQPFSKEHTAMNNWIISLVTYGEGYHNYHHTFAGDYRNGIRWYQFDPTKLLIWSLSKIGLVYDLRTVDRSLIARKLLMEDKKLLLDKAKHVSYIDSKKVEHEISSRAESLHAKLTEFSTLIRDYNTLKHQRAKLERKKLKVRMKKLKKSIRVGFRDWGKLCNKILRLKPTLS